MADSSNTTFTSEAIRLLRERARHAAAATQIFTRWSYLMEAHDLCINAGVPLHDDGRNHLSNPLMAVKKAASQASEKANPFIVLAANETLQMLEPDAVRVATIKRQKKREADARREEHWDAVNAVDRCVSVLGGEAVIAQVIRILEHAKAEATYLRVAQRVHEEEVAVVAAPNVVSFPGKPT